MEDKIVTVDKVQTECKVKFIQQKKTRLLIMRKEAILQTFVLIC